MTDYQPKHRADVPVDSCSHTPRHRVVAPFRYVDERSQS